MTSELNISPSAGIPVTREHIDFMLSQLKAYRRKASKRPEFTPYVHEIVSEIEMMRCEIDVQLEKNAKDTSMKGPAGYN